MSVQKVPDSLGVLFPAASLPMKAERSRNKERLEASLAGLCELELLKQRQEGRVLSALSLGDPPGGPGHRPWGALSLGDPPGGPGHRPWGALKSARCALDAPRDNAESLQTGTSSTTKASLEEQVADLKVNSDLQSADSPSSPEDVQQPSGCPESSPSLLYGSVSVPGTGDMETGESWLADPTRWAMVTDALGEMRDADPGQGEGHQAQKVETYIFGLIQRRALPTRSSKPRTCLAHDARGVRVVRQSSLCCKEEQLSPKPDVSTPPQGSEGTSAQACHNLDQEPYLGTGLPEDVPPPYHHSLKQSVQHQPGLYHRPRQVMNTSRPTLLDFPSCRVLQVQPDSSSSEPDSPQHFHNFPSSPTTPKPHPHPPPDEHLVNAEYIPAQPCRAFTRGYAHHHSNPYKGSGVPKANRNTYSPERSHHHHHHHHHQEQPPTAAQIQPSRSRAGPKKCRSNEDRNGGRKPGKKACRSQSENSLPRAPERKYNTVDRDGGGSGSGGRGSRSSQSRSKKQQQQQQEVRGSSCRRWQSTLELSQDEAEPPPPPPPPGPLAPHASSASNHRDHCARRSRKPRPSASHAYPQHQHAHHQQHMEYQLERDQVALCPPGEDFPHPRQGESESSMSEAESPDSSSLSSDSDESGGLVWPQQLPPQLALPSPSVPPGAPLQPKAFVKIKASHALKKKILRFRTGSLKVMTTV